MKISKVDQKEIRRQNAERLKILKEGAREELESGRYIPSGRRKLLDFLLREEELTGIREWNPSEKTLRRLRELPFEEDKLIEEELSPHKKWILRQAEEYLKRGDIIRFEDIIEAFEPSIKGKENLFLRRGDVWLIKFKGKWTVLNDNESLRYIIHLLDNPHKEILILDLMEAVKGANLDNIGNAYNPITGENWAVEGMNVSSYDIELSEEEIEKFKEIIEKVASELKAAQASDDETKKFNTQVKWKNLKNHLLKEHGLYVFLLKDYTHYCKKFKKLKPEIEKVRQIVKNQINKALKDIVKHLPDLSNYLRKHINQGLNCIYTPDHNDPIKWDIRW